MLSPDNTEDVIREIKDDPKANVKGRESIRGNDRETVDRSRDAPPTSLIKNRKASILFINASIN